MNVPSDLAERILQAGLRNVATKVGDEETMSAHEREVMMMFAMKPEIAQRLRAYELIKRHCKCEELTAAQWVEVNAVYPEFQPGSPPPPPPEGAQTFNLTGEPARKRLTKTYLAERGALYQRGPREIRRWITEGAPVDDPAKMPDWWEAERQAGRKTHSVPEPILRAAENASVTSKAATADPVTSGENSANAATPPANGEPTKQLPAPINLEDYDIEEGEELRDMKQLKAARWKELRQELAKPTGRDTRALETALAKMEDQISRISGRIEERLKKKGLFVHVAVVSRDIAKAIDLQRQMTDSEARRVTELCPALTPEMKAQVAAAVIRVGKSRRNILRNLKSLQSSEHAVRELAAA